MLTGELTAKGPSHTLLPAQPLVPSPFGTESGTDFGTGVVGTDCDTDTGFAELTLSPLRTSLSFPP